MGIQRLPEYQVPDPGGCIWLVQVKPCSLPDFDPGRVPEPREAAHSPGQWEAGLGLQRLLEKPRLHWGYQPSPHVVTDPWRYPRDSVPSCLWGHTSSPLPGWGLWLHVGQQEPVGSRGRHLGIVSGGTARGSHRELTGDTVHTPPQRYRLGTAGMAQTCPSSESKARAACAAMRAKIKDW